MTYRKPTLSPADLDLMWSFQDRARGCVLRRDEWYEPTVPQGVSVFIKRPNKIEYMFTKDDKYDGKVDYREADHMKVQHNINSYVPSDYQGIVLYMNKDALAMVARHKRDCGYHG